MSKATEVIYQTPTGGKANGYIIDGRTYKDSAGSQRVDIGSVVPTAGGTFMYTATGGVKTPQSIGNDLNKQYEEGYGRLAAGHSARTDAINAATNRTLADIDSKRKKADEQYLNSNQQAQATYLAASNPYGAAGEQAAKLGLDESGYSETSKLRLANAYQQNLSENLRAKNEYLNELDSAYRDARYKGDMELANAIAEYENLVYRHGIDAAEAIAAQENAAFATGVNMTNAMWERQRAERIDAQNRDDVMWERAFKLAGAGFSNSDIARTLGISLSELNRILRG